MENTYIIIAIPFIILIVCLIVFLKKRKIKHENFVLENSQVLSKLNKINKKYQFNYVADEIYSHTYDNINFYNTISCKDYLIYQLQFTQNKVMNDIKLVNFNKIYPVEI